MKDKFLLVVLLLLISDKNVFSQNLPRPIIHYIKKLQRKGADTILIYLSGCEGCEVKHQRVTCNCFNKDGIVDVDLIFKINGFFYKENFNCCKESLPTKMTGSPSIQYFITLKNIFERRDKFYASLIKEGKFLPPIPTDPFYEYVQLIVLGNKYEFSLSNFQRDQDYKVWKEYFWIDEEIKLTDLIRKDIGLKISTTSIPID